MSLSYVVFPELDTKIRDSGLLEKYPDLEDEKTSLWDVPKNEEVNGAARAMSDAMKHKIIDAWKHAVPNSIPWKNASGDTIAPQTNSDLLMLTGVFLDDLDIPEEILLHPNTYGFASTVEMILSLSAYHLSEESYEGVRKYHEWTTNGMRTILGLGGNSETKIFQADESDGKVISPFGVEVLFKPRKVQAINMIYNGEELRLFGIILRYTYELGVLKQIFPGLLEELRKELGDELKKSNERVDYLFSLSLGDAQIFIERPFGEASHGVPYHTGQRGSYIISKKGNDLVFSSEVDGITTDNLMRVTPEDCRNLLKGLFIGFYCTQKQYKDLLLDMIDTALSL